MHVRVGVHCRLTCNHYHHHTCIIVVSDDNCCLMGRFFCDFSSVSLNVYIYRKFVTKLELKLYLEIGGVVRCFSFSSKIQNSFSFVAIDATMHKSQKKVDNFKGGHLYEFYIVIPYIFL